MYVTTGVKKYFYTHASKTCLQLLHETRFRYAISGFQRSVVENFALLGCYATLVVSCLSGLRDSLFVAPKSRENKRRKNRKNEKKYSFSTASFLKMEIKGCFQTLVNNNKHKLHNIPQQRKTPLFLVLKLRTCLWREHLLLHPTKLT